MKSNKNLKLSKELVRIHAHLCGDGGLYTYKTSEKDRINRSEIVYFNTNIDLINSFRKDMNKLFGVKMTFYGKRHMLVVFSIRIADVLLKLSNYGTRKWRIPKVIKKSLMMYRLEWINAFCKDEGYLPADRNYIRIKSMNLYGLKDLKEMVTSLRIYSKITSPNCDKSYYLNIKKEGRLRNFSKNKSGKKIAGVGHSKDTFCKPHLNQRPLPRFLIFRVSEANLMSLPQLNFDGHS